MLTGYLSDIMPPMAPRFDVPVGIMPKASTPDKPGRPRHRFCISSPSPPSQTDEDQDPHPSMRPAKMTRHPPIAKLLPKLNGNAETRPRMQGIRYLRCPVRFKVVWSVPAMQAFPFSALCSKGWRQGEPLPMSTLTYIRSPRFLARWSFRPPKRSTGLLCQEIHEELFET